MTGTNLAPVRSTRQAQGKIRVLVVDDSVVIRHLVRHALKDELDMEVVGEAANGIETLARIPEVKPDVVTLDIEMPEMDGLEALRRIRRLHPRLRTVMFSTLTVRGGSATFEALSLGADDYVAKTANVGSLDRSLETLRTELLPKIRQFFHAPAPAPKPVPSPARLLPRRTAQFGAVAIGVSTGGPQALAELIPFLPAKLAVPLVVVQHMPPMFTRLLAERLDSLSPLRVVEAAAGMELKPATVFIAPGDYHLRLLRTGYRAVITLDQSPPENSCRPSVDVLFRSMAEVFGRDVLSVVLTGMGSDGLAGTRELKAAGAVSLVQDQASSVVWGMPGAVVQAGLADRILPLGEIAGEIARLIGA